MYECLWERDSGRVFAQKCIALSDTVHRWYIENYKNGVSGAVVELQFVISANKPIMQTRGGLCVSHKALLSR